jgi:hypothetical protein
MTLIIGLLLLLFAIPKTDCQMALDGISSMEEVTKNKPFDSILSKPFIRHRIVEEYFPGKITF